MNTFKYNLSFYYQSTIIYFVVFIIYVVIRGRFAEDTITVITTDPIIYFFGIIVLISIVGLLYNLFKGKHIHIDENGFSFIDRSGRKIFSKKEIEYVRLSREKRNRALRLVRVKLKNRRRFLAIRPSDYENEMELIKRFQELKSIVEKENV